MIVTFIYRVCSKETVDLDQSFVSHGLFSTVIQLPYGTNPGISVSMQDSEETRELATVQSEVTTSKMERIRNVEEGISTEKDGEP